VRDVPLSFGGISMASFYCGHKVKSPAMSSEERTPRSCRSYQKFFDREITVDSHILEYIGLGFSWNRVNYDDPLMEKIDELMEKYGAGLDDHALRFLIRELLMSRSANSSFWRFDL
jgi:hypothetical protein